MISSWRKNRFNRKMSLKLGWEPSWFGSSSFDNDLIKKIQDFQAEHSLKPDGMCGEMTYRRLLVEREAQLDGKNSIIIGGAPVEIKWENVVNLNDPLGMPLPPDCYSKKKRKHPSQIVTHFDVCLSAASCKKVLERRGLSSHFVIDNDGTIYQMVDPMYTAWHASGANKRSIGVDISNAYYLKYQSTYKKRGHGPRPVMKNLRVHGVKLDPCLGFYPKQIEAYKVLIKTLCDYYNIPIDCPKNDEGNLLRGVSNSAKNGKFKGVICHYHLTRNKIDCANLELEKVLSEIK